MIRIVRPWRGGWDRGSATVELVAVTPLIVLVFLAVVALGRLADARLVVADAAHQAARAASLARTDHAARTQAERAVREALHGPGPSCVHARVRLNTAGLAPGTDVTATVSCTVDLEDLTLTVLPGHGASTTEKAVSVSRRSAGRREGVAGLRWRR
jgi:Flp pilus assembly protein TadG